MQAEQPRHPPPHRPLELSGPEHCLKADAAARRPCHHLVENNTVTMLCYAMLCYAMLCYAMLCYDALYCAVVTNTIPYQTRLDYTRLDHTIPIGKEPRA